MKKCCDMRGFLSFLVLRMISKQDMSGEEIRAELGRRKGQRPSSGTIYPVLKTLSESGFIEEVKSAGKEKRYRLTKDGHREVKSATKKFLDTFCDLRHEFENMPR